MGADHVAEAEYLRTGDPVLHVSPPFGFLDQTGGGQDGEVPGDVGLGPFEPGDQFLDGFRPAAEFAQEVEPGRVAQGLKAVGDAADHRLGDFAKIACFLSCHT